MVTGPCRARNRCLNPDSEHGGTSQNNDFWLTQILPQRAIKNDPAKSIFQKEKIHFEEQSVKNQIPTRNKRVFQRFLLQPEILYDE